MQGHAVATVDVNIPDIGNFKDVPVVEVLVKPGDVVQVDQPLVTLESDKATMDVPSTVAGKVAEVATKAGDRVSMGTLVARIEETAVAGASFSEAARSSHLPSAITNVASTPATQMAKHRRWVRIRRGILAVECA